MTGIDILIEEHKAILKFVSVLRKKMLRYIRRKRSGRLSV